jgi:hypothetical protein
MTGKIARFRFHDGPEEKFMLKLDENGNPEKRKEDDLQPGMQAREIGQPETETETPIQRFKKASDARWRLGADDMRMLPPEAGEPKTVPTPKYFTEEDDEPDYKAAMQTFKAASDKRHGSGGRQ